MVRVEAVVRPNGSVRSTRVLGGNPVLVEAAQEAVAKWKFEPAQAETTEILQLAFESKESLPHPKSLLVRPLAVFGSSCHLQPLREVT